MATYAKLTFKTTTNLRNGLYEIMAEVSKGGLTLVNCRRVNKNGEEIDVKLDAARNVWVEENHLIDSRCIIKRVPMKMNLFYGELEAA